MQNPFTLAEFKRQLKPGLHVERSFYEYGRLVLAEKRVVSSVTSGGFTTRDYNLQHLSEMRFGKASEWGFDTYIAGWSAIWSDPENPNYQTQYTHVEEGF